MKKRKILKPKAIQNRTVGCGYGKESFVKKIETKLNYFL